MTFIAPNDPAVRVTGRVDDADPTRPVWVHPYTQAAFRCTGTSLAVRLVNRRTYGVSQLGAMIDGFPVRVPIPVDGETTTVTLASGLPDIEHDVVVFKRQDGQHYVELLGFELSEGARVLPPSEPRPAHRIEVFGDSVSCGERNEASLYVGKADPEADLSPYSNAWLSYAAITARALGAELHDVSQGGVSLLDGIGWFNAPDYVGQEHMWDKIEYNPALGPSKPWDFSRWTPHVVVVAVGQNDAHPDDFMKDDYDGDMARHWRARYVAFLRALRAHYPHAHIVCMTTVLRHDPSWDRAIGQAVAQLGDPNVEQFLFSRNGAATPGHPRVAEHEEMARELTDYLAALGPGIWKD
ncbi:electron transporter RnfD [Bifidobacterium pullorum subsp. saeculare]|uniref:Electron transporter RnfD n=1 Tax=Bifidobacterium pullorum subsp. saeculare TaxID=78257 RepID=A0A939B9S0_9BIFI|nr:GDSL-type esterase/lipase family protein [Bifidobacterium pullorum]MBM6699530.1 electron transporter RnfD [Bifidobacterium pullorum subsp. saeculare]